MELKNKVILIISPESWGKLFISKHNYAIALTARGNTVYFLSPIENELLPGQIKLIPIPEYPGLTIIKYQPFFPVILKFHAKKIFDLLMRIQVKRILKKMKESPDIVWDFNCTNLFPDLRIFHTRLSIFQPVDMVQFKSNDRKKADILISVSDHSINRLKPLHIPSYFINHGLSQPFVTNALQRDTSYKKKDLIKVCYIGNLLINALEREIVKNLITSHGLIQFYFIGPFSAIDNNIGGVDFNEEDKEFIEFLRNQQNVVLLGSMPGHKIADILDEFDMFFLCYKETPFFKNDNSHKVLEYLSSGKVVVSSRLSFYQNLGLLEMCEDGDNEKIIPLFDKVVKNLEYYNSPEMQKKRIAYAIDNSYERQLAKIEGILQNIGKS